MKLRTPSQIKYSALVFREDHKGFENVSGLSKLLFEKKKIERKTEQCYAELSEPMEAQGLHILSLGFIPSQHITSQPNSYSCVSAFQPFIFSVDPAFFPACHTAQSCA